MSDHGPEEPFEPEREEEPSRRVATRERDEKKKDEPERTRETEKNPWAKTSSGDADEIVDES